jgi:hypothetical protein
LFTGGLDSMMLLRRAEPDLCAYVEQAGNPYADEELWTIRRLQQRVAIPLVILRGAQQQEPEPDGHVLHRNLSLLTCVAANTAATTLLLGSVRGESSPDKSRRFLRAASRALSASEHTRIQVKAPLRRHTKSWWLQDHLSRWPEDYESLRLTRSCYSPHGLCGECLACFRRWVAFTLAGMLPEDHRGAPWARPLDDWRLGLRYVLRTPPGEWLGMLDNHRDALTALRRERGGST